MPASQVFGPRKITARQDPSDRETSPAGPKREDCIKKVQNIVEAWHCQSRSVAASCGCKILELVDFYKLAVHELITERYEVSAMTMEELNAFATAFAETCSNAMPQEEGATLEVANAMVQNAMGVRLGSRKQLWEETWQALGCNSLSAQPRIDLTTTDVPSSSKKKTSDQKQSVKVPNTPKRARQSSAAERTSSTTTNRNNGHEASQSRSLETATGVAGSFNLAELPDHPNPPAIKKKPKKRKCN